MLDIDEMGQKEIHELLHKVGYGHLGCIGEGHPYIVPMHYYLKDSEIYSVCKWFVNSKSAESLYWQGFVFYISNTNAIYLHNGRNED